MRTSARPAVLAMFLSVALLLGDVALAEPKFGRFFTTPAQRERIDENRNKDPEQRVVIQQEEVFVVDDIEEEEEVSVDALTVRGLVYRKGEKSTAWINDNNTFEGGISSQNITVGEIDDSKVEIRIPSADKKVELKVGKTYDPMAEKSNDIISDTWSTIKKALTGDSSGN